MQNIYLFVVRYPVTEGNSSSSVPIEKRSTIKTGAASTAVPIKKNLVGNVTPTLPKPRNGVINTLSGFIMLQEEDGEHFESGGDNVAEESNSEPNHTKQRRMAERRKDPIIAKNEGRKAKVNLNSFKSKYLTLKKKVSALQLEVGAKEDFILLVRNNLQDPSTAHQSSTAGKYMCYGVGPIAENFYTTGIKFENTEMVKMLNNYDYTQDLSVTEKTANGRNNPTPKKRKESQQVSVVGEAPTPTPTQPQAKKQKQIKKLIPTKVCTPGSFFDDQSVENSSDSDSGNAVFNDETNSGEGDAVREVKKQNKNQIPAKVFTPGSFFDNLTVVNSDSDSDDH